MLISSPKEYHHAGIFDEKDESSGESESSHHNRVRMIVKSMSRASSPVEDLPDSRVVTRGSFVVDKRKDFDVTTIRNAIVPDDMGSLVPLDDDDDDNDNGIDAANLSKVYKRRQGEESDDNNNNVVPSTNDDPKNYNKYRRPFGSSSRGKPFAISFIAACVAISLVTIFVSVFKARENDPIISIRQREKAFSKAKSTVNNAIPPPPNNDLQQKLNYLASLSEPIDYKTDVPFLWLIPATTSQQVRITMSRCLNNKFSRIYEGEEDGTDSLFNFKITPILESFQGHDPPHRGRMFTMFREPMIRTVDMWFMQNEKENISLEEWLNKHVDNNWMTRFLSNNFENPLTSQDLEFAKSIIREKCIVGLDEFKEDSFERFGSYFQWDTLNLDIQSCINTVLHDPKYDHDIQYPEEFSHEYKLLLKRNHMDVLLYQYAVELYHEQKSQFFPRLNI